MLAEVLAVIGTVFQIIGIPLGAFIGIFIGAVFVGKFIKFGVGSENE